MSSTAIPKNETSERDDDESIGIDVDIDAKEDRWTCEFQVARELKEKAALADLAVRAFGPYRCGDFYRVAGGGFRLPVIWIGEGPPVRFVAGQLPDFAQKLMHFATVRSVCEYEPNDANTKKLKLASAALKGRDPEAVDRFIAALNESPLPLFIDAGPSVGLVRFHTGELPSPTPAAADNLLTIANRRDVALIRTAGGETFLVADPDTVPPLKVGDRVRFSESGPTEQVRCIRASAVVVEGETGAQGRLVP